MMGKIDPSFKTKTNVDEGFKEYALAGLIGAASLGGVNNVKASNDINKNNIEMVYSDSITNKIKAPADLLNFAKEIIEKNYTADQVANIFNLDARKYFYSLIEKNVEWKNGFDAMLNMLEDNMREGSSYTIFLKTKSKPIADSLNIKDQSIVSYEDRKKLTNIFKQKGLSEYRDFIFMIEPETRNKEWNRMEEVVLKLEYFNWSLNR